MRQIVTATLAAALAVAALGVVGCLSGHGNLLPILFAGSLGTPFALEATVVKTVPLLLTGLAVALAFRAGVWNIGGEGQFIVGALAGFVSARHGVVVALLASALAGAAWATIASLMRIWRNAPEVLTTILLNFVAIHLLGYCVNGPLQEPEKMYPQTDAIPLGANLSLIGGSEVHIGTAVAVACAIASWWLLYRTIEGLRLRAVGFNPAAARFAGIRVERQMARAMALSGACAGLAGGIELLGVTHRLFERFAAGYGYSGIAVALLAQLHPLAVIASAFFIGALVTGAGELQRSADIPSTVATFGQAVVILAVLLFQRVDVGSFFKKRRTGAAT